jgi:hypothetical protein
MNNNRRFIPTAFALLLASVFVSAQTARKSVVEHFTNSNCSVCANNNPTFFSVLKNYPNVFHISFYPSSPYSACYFSKQNPQDNDARTKFYNLYGSTPRFTLNGESVNLSGINSRFLALESAVSNFSISTKQSLGINDSILVRVVITKLANDTLSQALLFSAAKEDTVFYNSPNSETLHHNVFRKNHTDINGNLIGLPALVNDSVVFQFAYKPLNNWDTKRLQTLSYFQNQSNKAVINASESNSLVAGTTSIAAPGKIAVQVYPNPASAYVHIQSEQNFQRYTVFSSSGKMLVSDNLENNSFSVKDLPNGLYFLVLENEGTYTTTKITINN